MSEEKVELTDEQKQNGFRALRGCLQAIAVYGAAFALGYLTDTTFRPFAAMFAVDLARIGFLSAFDRFLFTGKPGDKDYKKNWLGRFFGFLFYVAAIAAAIVMAAKVL